MIGVWCYQEQVATYPTYRLARAAMTRHIWTCPVGAMPWARPIRWHRVLLERYGELVTATAAHGEWLNHRIVQPLIIVDDPVGSGTDVALRQRLINWYALRAAGLAGEALGKTDTSR